MLMLGLLELALLFVLPALLGNPLLFALTALLLPMAVAVSL